MKRTTALAGMLILAAAVGASALSSTLAPSFAPAKNHATGKASWSVAMADLDGDGKADLATANIEGRSISVLRNDGDGTFEARHDYRTGRRPVQIAVGDLNGDGKADVVTANDYSSTVSVLLNRGDGSFQAKGDYTTGRNPSSVAIGDMNGDRRQDLATANFDTTTVSVLLNRGDGSFEAKRDYRTGDAPVFVAVGDLNGDGKPDLAIADHDGYTGIVSVLLNRGDGSFSAQESLPGWTRTEIGCDRRPERRRHAGHGDRELLGVGRKASNRSEYRLRPPQPGRRQVSGQARLSNWPRPRFGGDRRSGRRWQGRRWRPANAGPDDLPAVSVSVLLNNGDATFQPKLDYKTGGSPLSVAVGDLNNDREPDLATANGTTAVSVLIDTPGLCAVQDVRRKKLPAATLTLARVNCQIGMIRRAYSRFTRKGRVISQKPRFGAVLPGGRGVNLVVSRGRRP